MHATVSSPAALPSVSPIFVRLAVLGSVSILLAIAFGMADLYQKLSQARPPSASGPTLAGAAVCDSDAGKAHYMTCALCHGDKAQGNPLMKGPALAGQSAWYVAGQLKSFRLGHRGVDPKDLLGMQMRPMSMVLPDDKAVQDVAAYIATLPVAKPATTLTGGDVARGKITFAVCTACHGADAKGIEAMGSPTLRNQHDWYLLSSLKAFKAKIRGSHPDDAFGKTMQPMAAILADETAMKDVIAYIQSLK